MSRCVYLGHVGDGEVCSEATKIQAVSIFSQPMIKKNVRAFLELTGYYHRFVPDYAAIALPLTDVTKKAVLGWTAACDAAFRELK